MTLRGYGIAAAAAVLWASAGALPSTSVSAQDDDPAAASSPTAGLDLSDEEVEMFAEAQHDVISINRKWNDRMRQASSYDERQQMQQRARQEMVTAVEDSGLSVKEYNRIAGAMQTNEALQVRVRDALPDR